MTTAHTETAENRPDGDAGPPPARPRGPLRATALPLLMIAIGAVAGTAYGLATPPTYEASAHVLVTADRTGAGPDAVNYAQAYGRLASLPETLAWAPSPPWGRSVDAAARSVHTSTSPDTPLIRLIASASRPDRAATLANAAAAALVRYGSVHQQDTGVRVVLMSNALVPADASSPKPALDIAVGAAAGGLLAALAALAGVQWPQRGTRRRTGDTARPSGRRHRAEQAAAEAGQ
ncbi:hypothetical protein [Actinomadura gamaensis]|uniref:Lipopolysaccharide biosynthesis protein n=1 Tax=Actinomadura gamaensis TaxID=1763541 RepID=A0ABV9U3N8_9ACTN